MPAGSEKIKKLTERFKTLHRLALKGAKSKEMLEGATADFNVRLIR